MNGYLLLSQNSMGKTRYQQYPVLQHEEIDPKTNPKQTWSICFIFLAHDCKCTQTSQSHIRHSGSAQESCSRAVAPPFLVENPWRIPWRIYSPSHPSSAAASAWSDQGLRGCLWCCCRASWSSKPRKAKSKMASGKKLQWAPRGGALKKLGSIMIYPTKIWWFLETW